MYQHDLRDVIAATAATANGLNLDDVFFRNQFSNFIGWAAGEAGWKLKIAVGSTRTNTGHAYTSGTNDAILFQHDSVGVQYSFYFVRFPAIKFVFVAVNICGWCGCGGNSK